MDFTIDHLNPYQVCNNASPRNTNNCHISRTTARTLKTSSLMRSFCWSGHVDMLTRSIMNFSWFTVLRPEGGILNWMYLLEPARTYYIPGIHTRGFAPRAAFFFVRYVAHNGNRGPLLTTWKCQEPRRHDPGKQPGRYMHEYTAYIPSILCLRYVIYLLIYIRLEASDYYTKLLSLGMTNRQGYCWMSRDVDGWRKQF